MQPLLDEPEYKAISKTIQETDVTSPGQTMGEATESPPKSA